MPFISKDWRSPGEAWVKTEEGWEKKKVLENCKALQKRDLEAMLPKSQDRRKKEEWLENKHHGWKTFASGQVPGTRCVDQLFRLWQEQENVLQNESQRQGYRTRVSRNDSSEEESDSDTAIQPHCHITIKCTKEIAGFNELDEAVKRLDFRSAVRDVRRFNYICALLELLIGQQMTALSGCSQKVLLAMLEEVASHATSSQHNPRGFRQLLTNLRALRTAERDACWGGTLGSQLLWDQHATKIERILNMAAEMQIREPNPNSQPKLMQLPEECIREIILRLSDHKDLVASAESCEQMAAIVSEQRIWRELTKFHFVPQQIDLVLSKDNSKIDWKEVYHSLKKTFGINEERQYAEMLSLCRYCRCLFWRSLGHPCIADQCPEFRARIQEAGGVSAPSPVPPSAFLKFFSL